MRDALPAGAQQVRHFPGKKILARVGLRRQRRRAVQRTVRGLADAALNFRDRQRRLRGARAELPRERPAARNIGFPFGGGGSSWW